MRRTAGENRRQSSLRAMAALAPSLRVQFIPLVGIPFRGRGEDRNNPEGQAEAHDATDRVAMLVRLLEDRVVVELGVGRSPHLAPVAGEPGHDSASAHPRQGLRGRHAAVERHAGKHLDLRALRDRQLGDNVKLSSSASWRITAGRYQPGGGGERRTRARRSMAPRRSRMRQSCAPRAAARPGPRFGGHRTRDRRRAVLFITNGQGAQSGRLRIPRPRSRSDGSAIR